jgi:hypothetical protein
MDRNQAAKTNVFDYVERDLVAWQQELEHIRRLITQGEISRDGDEFQDARKKIAGLLNEMEQARDFIASKRGVAAEVTRITSDAEILFSADQAVMQFDEPEADLRLQDEDISG